MSLNGYGQRIAIAETMLQGMLSPDSPLYTLDVYLVKKIIRFAIAELENEIWEEFQKCLLKQPKESKPHFKGERMW